mmetsp:Transcript_22694/g.37344  ORF Transcript_22694/g.37344 Transcript_22694/m.37344 type:complete len:235 (-) Transcript_22694:2281-2985(-)
MHQRALPVILGHFGGKAVHQPVHRRNVLGLRGAVLLGPAGHLPLQIVTGGAIIGQANGLDIDLMQGGQHPVHVGDHGRAPRLVHLRHARFVKVSAHHMVHHVEIRTDDAGVLAQDMHLGHRHIRTCKGALHPKLPVHRMGGFQKLPGGLAAQHVIADAGLQQKSGIGLTALEFMRLNGTIKPRQSVPQERGNGSGLQGLRICHVSLRTLAPCARPPQHIRPPSGPRWPRRTLAM